MVRVGKNGGVSDVPPSKDGGKTSSTAKNQNKPNCVWEAQSNNLIVGCNDKGQIIEKYRLNDDGSVSSHKKYEYDDKGQMVKEEEDFEGGGEDGRSPDGKPDYIFTYEYNDKGQTVKSGRDFRGGGEDGESPDGKPDYIFTYEYNDKGQMVKSGCDFRDGGEDGKSPDGKVDEVGHYVYDDKGEVIGFGSDRNVDGFIEDWYFE